MSRLTYQDSGVDPEKAGKILSSFAKFQKGRPQDPNIVSGIGPFASCYSLKTLLQGKSDPILVTCCDGVGTKLKLAIDWGNITGLGQDLVGMNVNDLLCAGARPLLFLDYYACGKLEEGQLSTLLKSIQGACEVSRCQLVGGETAEMPGLYHASDFDLAGFAVGIADRTDLLGPQKVKAGDTLLAFESSGFHSNGFSLVRKIVEKENLKPGDSPSFAPSKTWKDLLLEPTTLYVPLFADRMSEVNALAHITGGGLFENLPRVIPTGHRAVVKANLWNMPSMYGWFGEKAGLDAQTLLSTFNCGVGMIAVLPEPNTERLIAHAKSLGIRAWRIGTVEATGDAGQGPTVVWE